MLKEFAWKTFENTGNITSYIFYREIEDNSRVQDPEKIAKDEAAISNA